MLKMKDKKGNFQITEQDVRNLQVEIEQIILNFKKKKETDWYGRLGEFAKAWEYFCITINMPILGISVLKKAIKRVQSTPTEFTNCHLPYVKLCWRAECCQHALPILAPVHTSVRASKYTAMPANKSKRAIPTRDKSADVR